MPIQDRWVCAVQKNEVPLSSYFFRVMRLAWVLFYCGNYARVFQQKCTAYMVFYNLFPQNNRLSNQLNTRKIAWKSAKSNWLFRNAILPIFQSFWKTTIFLQAENTLDFCFCRLWKCRQHEMETKSSEIAIEVHCCAKRSLWLFTMGGESIWFNQCGFTGLVGKSTRKMTTCEPTEQRKQASNPLQPWITILMSCSSLPIEKKFNPSLSTMEKLRRAKMK